MADYTLKLYRRQHPNEAPGALVGMFTLDAGSAEEAVAHAKAAYASHLADCDYAFISARHGRVVWETTGKRVGDA